MNNIIFLFIFFLISCVSLPKSEDVCETDAEVVRSSYLLERYISDRPFRMYYYPTIKLRNLGDQCKDYISKINEVGDYFFDKFRRKSKREMEIALNKEIHLDKFHYMLPGSGKSELKIGQRIQIKIYRYKEIETIFSSTFFSTKIRISKIY